MSSADMRRGVSGRIQASSARRRIFEALKLATDYGQTDGAHHKMWVIDQIVRVLAGDEYPAVIKAHNDGDDGPETYAWDEGIAP